MSQTKSLKVNSVINIIKTVLSIIFPLITFPYASRVLGVNGIGRVDYARKFGRNTARQPLHVIHGYPG